MFNKSIVILAFATSLFAANICVDNNVKIDKDSIKIKKEIIPNGRYYTDESVKNVMKDEEFFANAFIKQFGLDKETKKALALSINETLTKLYKRKLEKKYAPDEKVLKSFYLDHIDEFAPEMKVDISTITFLSLKKADEVYGKLKDNPGKFDEYAKKYSIDKNIHFQNVELSKLAYPVREWIRKSKKGDISAPIKVGKLYFIDRIDNKKEIRPTYENLKPYLKSILVNIYVNKKMKEIKEEAK